MRLRERDFEEVQHAGGVSPAWPISLTDLAPYYAEAETLWQVHGARGDDPTENGDEPPYAYPAVHARPGHRRSSRPTGRTQGWKPFSLPLGVKLDQAHPVTSTCIKCKTCGGYPCLLKAKCDARTIAIEPLLDLPNVTLLTGRKVMRLETDPVGQDGDRGGLPDRARRGALERRHRGAGGRRGQHRRPAAGLGQRRPTRTAWPTAPTRSGATTCSTP